MAKPLDHCIEAVARRGPVRVERAGMKFVEYVVFQWKAAPSGIIPDKGLWIHDLRGAVYTFGEKARNGVRHRFVVVYLVEISVARRRSNLRKEMAVVGSFELRDV